MPKKPPKRSGPRPPRPALAGEASADYAPSSRSEFAVTTVRLRADQWTALREVALRRASAMGGKPDASQLLREIVDDWMKRRREEEGRGG